MAVREYHELEFGSGRKWNEPIPVAAQTEAWTVLALSNTKIVGSNPTGGTDVRVRLFYVCVALRVDSGLATGWASVQGSIPTVYRIRKTQMEAKAQQKAYRA
jgi:hypothetical protein